MTCCVIPISFKKMKNITWFPIGTKIRFFPANRIEFNSAKKTWIDSIQKCPFLLTWALRPNVMVPLGDSFFFLTFIWPPKAKRLCNSSAYGPKKQGLPRVRFLILGTIPARVKKHWSPYGVHTHFLWHHVAQMMMNEPQSGTITFGLRERILQ